MQQLRYNEGKAKLSYFFVNQRAIRELATALGANDNNVDLDELSETAAECLVGFLSRAVADSRFDLAGAAINLILALQEDATGASENVVLAGTVYGFLASAPDALAAFCAVCEYGEVKYLRGNFRKGAPITQYLDSALRHLNARLRGEINDPESKKPHLAHALWNVWTALDQPDSRDDRLPAVCDPNEKPDALAEDLSDLPEPREEMIPPAYSRDSTEKVFF